MGRCGTGNQAGDKWLWLLFTISGVARKMGGDYYYSITFSQPLPQYFISRGVADTHSEWPKRLWILAVEIVPGPSPFVLFLLIFVLALGSVHWRYSSSCHEEPRTFRAAVLWTCDGVPWDFIKCRWGFMKCHEGLLSAMRFHGVSCKVSWTFNESAMKFHWGPRRCME